MTEGYDYIDDWRPDPYILSIVRDALDKMWDGYEPDENYPKDKPSKRLGAYWDKNRPESWTNLRLDWELTTGTTPPPIEKLRPLLNLQMENDLADLLENGDSTQFQDPLRKVLDGSKKRGKTLKSLQIVALQLFEEVNERKDSIEYTLYVSVKPEWDDAASV